jgi:hypothetical protein
MPSAVMMQRMPLKPMSVPLNGVDPTDLVGFWKLEEASGTRADSSGNGNHLDIISALTPGNAVGLIGNALDTEFNNADYVGRADNASLSMGDVDMTLWGWFRPTVAQTGTIVGKIASTSTIEYKVDISSWPNLRFLVSGDGTTSQDTAINASGVLAVDTWFFFCARHDSVNNLIRLRWNTTDITAVAHSTGIFNGTNEFRIGKTELDPGPITGLIDEVGMMKRHLSDAEVTALYNGGSGVTY